ncbi:MAG: trypsin-like peptidase domain-containing protein [Candidatus Omnitrophica bacterium]|nr:trypsin-like peptidase domain-containing protein [Candidatus Omnitrophota bacterium]
MPWDRIVEKIKSYLVKIETPTGSGTGFLCLYNDSKEWCGIATAWHVVQYADEWQQPIKIIHEKSPDPIFLKEHDRVIFSDWKTDSAIIFFPTPKKSDMPKKLLPLRPLNKVLDIGAEVGWLGFPYLEPSICFFSGCISARREDRKAYLIDGVSINGVSGGPVFYSTETEGTEIIGIISAYVANRATGATLPGLSIAQDVSHLHDIAQTIKSWDEAKKKKQQLKEKEEKDKDKKIATQPTKPIDIEPVPKSS